MDEYQRLDELLITSGNANLPIKERQEAFTEFYRGIKGFVRSRLIKQVNNYDDREVLAQDIYTRLWSKASQYRPQENLFPYIDKIIRNIIINYQKRHGRRWKSLNLEGIPNWENRIDSNGKFHKEYEV